MPVPRCRRRRRSCSAFKLRPRAGPRPARWACAAGPPARSQRCRRCDFIFQLLWHSRIRQPFDGLAGLLLSSVDSHAAAAQPLKPRAWGAAFSTCSTRQSCLIPQAILLTPTSSSQVRLFTFGSHYSRLLQQVVADWKEVQHLSGALRSWRMLPDFSCSDEGTRIGVNPAIILPVHQKFALMRASAAVPYVLCWTCPLAPCVPLSTSGLSLPPSPVQAPIHAPAPDCRADTM